jgi:nucleoid-associated protein YgaU
LDARRAAPDTRENHKIRRIVEDTMADDKTPAADNPYTQTYVVQSGDTLSKIAQKYYGDPALYTQIFEANRDVLKDPNKIFPGQKLKIP